MIETDRTDRLVGQEVSLQREHTRVGETFLTPKRAQIVDFDTRFTPSLPATEGHIVLEGEAFPAANVWLGRRTVFLEHPVNIDNTPYYLEIKGYGQNGRQLWPNKHSEGDLMFGMYFENAQREFYSPQELRELGVNNIQVPVALLKFDEADFVEYTMKMLGEVVVVKSTIYERVRNGLKLLVPNAPDIPRHELLENKEVRRELERKVGEAVLSAYKGGGKDGLRALAQETDLEDEMEGITDERQAGYIIRAVKSPIRVGDLQDRRIITERNKKIARKIGKTVRKMLEKGYIDTSPNPGNWTTEGELVDFEDVLKFPENIEGIQQLMLFYQKTNMAEYLEYIFGRGTTGYLTIDFQHGFMGKVSSTDEVVEKALLILSNLAQRSTR